MPHQPIAFHWPDVIPTDHGPRTSAWLTSQSILYSLRSQSEQSQSRGRAPAPAQAVSLLLLACQTHKLSRPIFISFIPAVQIGYLLPYLYQLIPARLPCTYLYFACFQVAETPSHSRLFTLVQDGRRKLG